MDLLKFVRTAATKTWFVLEDTFFCSPRGVGFCRPPLLWAWGWLVLLVPLCCFHTTLPPPYLTSNKNHDFEFPHQTGPAAAPAPCRFPWNLGLLSPVPLIPWSFHLTVLPVCSARSLSWSHQASGWFFHGLCGLLVSWPPPVSCTRLHTSDLLYSNNVLIIIVTVTPSIISGTLLSDHRLSPFQLTPSPTNIPYLSGTYDLLTLLPFQCSSAHSLFSVQLKFCGQP